MWDGIRSSKGFLGWSICDYCLIVRQYSTWDAWTSKGVQLQTPVIRICLVPQHVDSVVQNQMQFHPGQQFMMWWVLMYKRTPQMSTIIYHTRMTLQPEFKIVKRKLLCHHIINTVWLSPLAMQATAYLQHEPSLVLWSSENTSYASSCLDTGESRFPTLSTPVAAHFPNKTACISDTIQ